MSARLVTCQCTIGTFPCTEPATQEDLLCDVCRAVTVHHEHGALPNGPHFSLRRRPKR